MIRQTRLANDEIGSIPLDPERLTRRSAGTRMTIAYNARSSRQDVREFGLEGRTLKGAQSIPHVTDAIQLY